MSTLVIVLRIVSLLAFAGPMLLLASGRHREPRKPASPEGGSRAPLVANLSAFGVFVPSLLIFAASSVASTALPAALSGCLLALAGAALVFKSRAELGLAWSLVPKADQGTGLVTTGPYRFVRHPIYAGLILATFGWSLFRANLLGLALTAVLFIFFDLKSRHEERWLVEAHPAYPEYQRRVRKLVPFLY
jgi:protein-S-isoprenylcysteine O-methyltransferase Ste14